MKRLILKLGCLGVLSSLCFAGLNAAAGVPKPRLVSMCCASTGSFCCAPHGCYADDKGCRAD